MNTRKLLIGLIVAGLFAAGFGSTILPAGAQQRTVYVTLATGETVPVTVDVPPGTPADQVQVPNVTTPVVSVSDSPPPASTDTQATTPPTPDPTTQQAAPTAQPQPSQQEQQQTTQTPKPQGQGKTKTLEEVVKKATDKANKDFTAQGVPTTTNPTVSLALPGPAPIGVPNF
ncbi:MAG: hypothetical protein QOH62_3433, partial [Solirubrobacteraceae bacterium]|nr:hypothetical protein [Solirubrobacteraceae bacterium]